MGQRGTEMATMPLGAHLEELRARLIKCIVALAVAFALCWIFRRQVMAVLKRPHVLAMRALGLETTLKFCSYLEPVMAQLKGCLVVAAVLTAPVLIYQAWAFVAPGLFPHERSKGLKLGAACLACFAAGVGFGYFVFVPVALRYLIGLSGPDMSPVLMVGSYLGMFFVLTFAMGVAFQTPVVVFYLLRWGVLSEEAFRKSRKPLILAAFVLGAVLTPPDPLTQIMMAVTLIMLFDIGGLLAAPSRETLAGFLKFTGTVAILGGGFVAWHMFWPVAHVTALSGRVTVAGREVAADGPVAVRRGAVCAADEGAVARILFSKGQDRELYLTDGRIQLRGPGKAALLNGESLAVSSRKGAQVALQAGPVQVLLEAARAEVKSPEPGTATVTVFEGQAAVKTQTGTRRIFAGHTATFHEGGTPTDVSGGLKRWQALTRAGKEGPPSPDP